MNKKLAKVLGYIFGIMGILSGYLAVIDLNRALYVILFSLIELSLLLIGSILFYIGVSE